MKFLGAVGFFELQLPTYDFADRLENTNKRGF
jgi:hypothetical protein